MKKLVKVVKHVYLKKVKKMTEVEILQMESGLCMNVFQNTIVGLKNINSAIDAETTAKEQQMANIKSQMLNLELNKQANEKMIDKFENFLS